MKNGSKVLLYYLILTYAPQSLFSVLFTSYYIQDYKGYSEGLYLKIILLFFIGLLIFLGQSFLNNRSNRFRYQGKSYPVFALIANRTRLALATVFMALSIPFGLEYGFSFFHSGLYISDLPFWVIALQAMKSIARLDLAYCTVKVLRGQSLSNTDIYTTLVYTIGGVISLAGSIDIMFLALGFLLVFGRGRLIMRAFAALEGKTKRSTRLLVYSLLVASMPLVAVIGFANKIGFERTFDLASDQSLFREAFAIPLVLRVSSSHGSFIANAELPMSLNEQVESLSYPVNNMFWRGCVLFVNDGCPYRQDITHIARLNYVRSFWDQSPLKAGATPGLLASALYIPALPIAIIILSFYCSIFTSAIDRAVGSKRLPPPGILVLLLFVYPVFENPIDLLVIFDPAFAYTVGLYFVLRSLAPGNSANQRLGRQTQGGTIANNLLPADRGLKGYGAYVQT